MSPSPLFLSPALPSELLTYIISKCTYPTTLIVCSTRTDFLSSLTSDVLRPVHPDVIAEGEVEAEEPEQDSAPTGAAQITTRGHLLTAPLFQVAVSKHIRIVFTPTVSHLRVFLSLFSVTKSGVTPPPLFPQAETKVSRRTPLLIAFGFLDIHRDTSEWSAQGLGNTSAALVDAAAEAHFRAVVVEAVRPGDEPSDLDSVVREHVPVLSTSSARKVATDPEDSGWSGRTVEIGRVLGRWFRSRNENWGRPA